VTWTYAINLSTQFSLREMLTGAPGALVKDMKKEII